MNKSITINNVTLTVGSKYRFSGKITPRFYDEPLDIDMVCRVEMIGDKTIFFSGYDAPEYSFAIEHLAAALEFAVKITPIESILSLVKRIETLEEQAYLKDREISELKAERQPDLCYLVDEDSEIDYDLNDGLPRWYETQEAAEKAAQRMIDTGEAYVMYVYSVCSPNALSVHTLDQGIITEFNESKDR